MSKSVVVGWEEGGMVFIESSEASGGDTLYITREEAIQVRDELCRMFTVPPPPTREQIDRERIKALRLLTDK